MHRGGESHPNTANHLNKFVVYFFIMTDLSIGTQGAETAEVELYVNTLSLGIFTHTNPVFYKCYVG